MVKKAAVINDLSGFGKCSLTAAIPVLSCLGIQACPLPTAILSNQTGYDSFYLDDYTDRMDHFIRQWQKHGAAFDAIATGFLADERQVGLVEKFLRVFRRPDTLLVVDPVMGDGGHLYATCTAALCARVRTLAFQADVITPNLTEACILLDQQPEASLPLETVRSMARRLMEAGPGRVVITGVVEGSQVHNVVGEFGKTILVTSPLIGGSFSGTGDLLTAVVTAAMVQRKHSLGEIVGAAADFIGRAAQDALLAGTDPREGIAFEPHLHTLWEELH